jgi:exonuclease III
VAILFKPKLEIKLSTIEKDPDGRFILVDIEVDDLKCKLMNIYAPNKGKDREEFFTTAKDKLLPHKDNCDFIICGDMNCTIDPKIDRRQKTSESTEYDKGLTQLNEMIDYLDLEDVWCRRHPGQRRYTYFKPNSSIASRIDNCFISKSMDSYIINSSISTSIETDHCALLNEMKTTKVERGKGYWKMNDTVLNSQLFYQHFRALWPKWESQKHLFENTKLWWEFAKQKN